MSHLLDTARPQGTFKPLGTNDPGLRRGWFYRAIAANPQAQVLAVGAPFARRWFPNFIEGTLQPAVAAKAQFPLVIVHATLGGCPSLEAALASAHALVAPRGSLVLSGYNRVRTRHDASEAKCLPRATPWGYRHLARRAGFREVDVFAVRPGLDDFTFVLSTARRSARAFYRFDLAAQLAAGQARWPTVRRLVAHAGLATWFEPGFVVLARKC